MAAPLRKPRKSVVSAPTGEKRRFVIRLSGPMAALLGTILAVAVGWSFFMGFMVGRGQNPETRVEQMTSMISKDAPAAKGKAAQQDAPAPDAAATAETADGQNAAPVAEAAAGAAPQQAAAGKPADAKGQKAAGTSRGRPNSRSRLSHRLRPILFRSLHPTVWLRGASNREPMRRAHRPKAEPQTVHKTARRQPSQPRPKPAPQFDYVYQVAAFKSDEDADKLRTRLEGKGLHTRTQKNGKLVLVMVNLRGTEDDAFNLREDLRHMKLGVPIMVSQKPVSNKPQKAGR
jgi:cell division protein FtsN